MYPTFARRSLVTYRARLWFIRTRYVSSRTDRERRHRNGRSRRCPLLASLGRRNVSFQDDTHSALNPSTFNRVYQMSLLEIEDNGSGVPQGVVLVIVGPPLDPANPIKEGEIVRIARMYNLTSLVNLAKWTISQKVRSCESSISDNHNNPTSGCETTGFINS